ncbi:MAG TPA: phosphate-starvation-inducible PsiE family protein [Terracidiphilus sp.]|jgi:uncharacterized membrane protein (DUF373 family)
MTLLGRPKPGQAKGVIATGLMLVEDVVYIGLGVLLAAAAIWLLGSAMWTFVSELASRSLSGQLVGLLDQILLVLLIIELLYTVQISFREHSLVAEPFLVVALIACVRKILVLTAQIPELPEGNEAAFRHQMIELAVLSAMVVVFVSSFIVLQKHASAMGDNARKEQVPG